MPSNQRKRKINASPTKTFFIDILVKDVQLIDSILDLIDNAIDSYIENKIRDRREIMVNFSKDSVIIKDNCGGIEKNKIYDRVFRFGLPTESRGKTIGVFGIGMKRAIFKMGNNILIESDDGENYYSVRFDKKWLADENNWELDFVKEEKTKGEKMTKITVTELHPNISQEFTNPKFENILIDRIKDTYSIFIEEKVTIKINDNIVDSYDFNFLYDNKNFVPFHKIYNFDDVEVEIFAGYTPSEPQEKENVYGWWIFCNDRLVLKNNTTEKTGWGGFYDKERRYHYPEDNRFLGIAIFRSENAMSLPWHTTKEDIQEDSRIYRRAQMEMKSITKRFTDVIRLAGRTKDPDTGETVGKALFEGIDYKPRKEIKKEITEVVPIIKGEIAYELKRIPDITYITYAKKKKIVKKVKKKLGNVYMTNKEVGQKTFDYFVKMEEIEND